MLKKNFYFGLIEGFEPKTSSVSVKEERRKKERKKEETLGE